MQSKSTNTIRADSIQFNIVYCHIDAGDTNPDPNTCSRNGWNPTVRARTGPVHYSCSRLVG